MLFYTLAHVSRHNFARKNDMENTQTIQQTAQKGRMLLSLADRHWQQLRSLREKRTRNRNYTYGNQWCDTVSDEFGNRMSEYELLRQSGKEPLSNNLIRQLVKSVVGRFRSGLPESEQAPGLNELDSRLMEEFLISGCCFQKIGHADGTARIENVAPDHILLNPVTDPLGRDCSLIGQLHDLPPADIIRLHANGSRRRAEAIARLLKPADDAGECPEMMRSRKTGCLRVLELWTRESREGYEWHDTERGEWLFATTPPDNPATGLRWTLRSVWRCHWLTAGAGIISQYDSPFAHRQHPYAFKLYPLVDGEIHSLVEDVIDQQKYVNRLITLVDHIMGASAKGVLLYPDDILPEGYNWDDLRYAWSKPNAIIPYHPRCSTDKPQQIATNATNIGAYEMLNLQMRLFEQISGVSGALQGQQASGNVGAKLYESQIANSSIALSDLFESFESFRHDRDLKLRQL